MSVFLRCLLMLSLFGCANKHAFRGDQELEEEAKSLWLMLDEIKASDINNFREMLEQETVERLAEGAAIIHSSKTVGDLLN